MAVASTATMQAQEARPDQLFVNSSLLDQFASDSDPHASQSKNDQTAVAAAVCQAGAAYMGQYPLLATGNGIGATAAAAVAGTPDSLGNASVLNGLTGHVGTHGGDNGNPRSSSAFPPFPQARDISLVPDLQWQTPPGSLPFGSGQGRGSGMEGGGTLAGMQQMADFQMQQGHGQPFQPGFGLTQQQQHQQHQQQLHQQVCELVHQPVQPTNSASGEWWSMCRYCSLLRRHGRQ